MIHLNLEEFAGKVLVKSVGIEVTRKFTEDTLVRFENDEDIILDSGLGNAIGKSREIIAGKDGKFRLIFEIDENHREFITDWMEDNIPE